MRSCLLLCCYIERNGEIENRKAASIVLAALILEKALLFVNYIQNIGYSQYYWRPQTALEMGKKAEEEKYKTDHHRYG